VVSFSVLFIDEPRRDNDSVPSWTRDSPTTREGQHYSRASPRPLISNEHPTPANTRIDALRPSCRRGSLGALVEILFDFGLDELFRLVTPVLSPKQWPTNSPSLRKNIILALLVTAGLSRVGFCK